MSIYFTIERPVAQGGTIMTMYFDLDWARRHKQGLVDAGKCNASQVTISTTDENGNESALVKSKSNHQRRAIAWPR